jgi:hypothetical protein
MSAAVVESDALTGSALDPRVSLRCATVATSSTAALWHGVNAVSLPAEAAGAIAGGLALGVAQLAWAIWLMWRPSRRCLLVGVAAAVATIVASVVVLWAAARTGPVPIVAPLTGSVLQLTLLALTTLGAVRTASPGVLRAATCAGLVCVAVTMSVVVAGGSHGHGTAIGSGPAVPTTTFLCHLV